MKNESYIKVLGDLKVLMKRKMLEDKQHKSQHKDMKKEDGDEDDYEEEETEEKETTKKDNYVSDYMKSKSNRQKPRASALMISMSAPEKPKKSSGNSGNYNKKKM